MGKNEIENQCDIGIENKCVILLDIEGTTTSIDFVKDVLFVKAREEAKKYFLQNFDNGDTQEIIKYLKEQIDIDVNNGTKSAVPLPQDDCSKDSMVEALVKNILAMMDADRKIKPLKTLQGRIWKECYENGIIKGHIYEDVVPALMSWKAEGKKICIYSSGSIEAQKLLFKYSSEGNILHYFKEHFDTTTGQKTEPKSYEKIAQKLDASPDSILFITDVEAEAEAASSIGIEVILSIRPGTKPLSAEALENFRRVKTFSDVVQSTASLKRRHSDVDENQKDQTLETNEKVLKKYN